MRREEFLTFCRARDAGEEKYVENEVAGRAGKVIACAEDRFEVMVDGEKKRWPHLDCRETWSTSAYKKYQP